ncbi:helix-turn-helix transcriptional regulator [Paludibacterium purpuratum]|uniref:LuxR family transcriptional regulator n=1 Tax=Paludibacterium purpuratum TaxID=1144873 RepID=A0A4R7AZG2_9NEIS|nr:helix-turn-helix transcriptional regulator [Paludibacterium purpuratum]TDR73821.1 LuxR family transcriptional regulator [Paludibacterium purpuratum]
MDSPITPQLKHLVDTLPGFWYCKDVQSTYLYINQHDAELLGLQHKEEFVGQTDLDLPCGAAESAHLFRAQDREVIHSGQILRMLDIHRYGGNQWRALLTCKAPLRDQDQNIIGVIGHGQELDSHELLELGVLLGKIADSPVSGNNLLTSRTSYIIGHPGHGPKLTQRQQEILFLLLRGRSARLIGRALGISTRTVEWHVGMLKEKFAALSKSELIDKAIEQGFLNNLPPGLCKRSLSLILRDA